MARPISARLTAAEGRRFAFTVGTAMLVLGAVAAWRGARAVAWAVGAVGILLLTAGVVVPTRLGPVERGWCALAAGISKVTTPIVMGVLYYLVITPAGIVARVSGHNPLRGRRTRSTVWVHRAAGTRRSDLERQF